MTDADRRLSSDVATFLEPLVDHLRAVPWESAPRLAQNLYVIARDYMRVDEGWNVMVKLGLIAGGMRPLPKKEFP